MTERALGLALRVTLALALIAPGCARTAAPLATPTGRPIVEQADRNAWRSARPAAGHAGQVSYPTPTVTTFDNGLRMYSVQKPVGTVSIALTSRSGSRGVAVGKSGLAALTASMMTEGTRRKTSLELAIAFESLGAGLYDDAGREHVELSTNVLATDLPAALDLLHEVVLEPAFDKAELERVRAEWLDDLRTGRQDPSKVAALVGLRALLGEHLGAPVEGSISNIERITRADLVAFHARAFVPGECAVLIAGDVDAGTATDLVRARFGAWKPKAPAVEKARATTVPPPEPRALVVDRPGAVQTSFFVAQPFPARTEPGHEARMVMNGMVGGLFTSRLNQNLRETHSYTYGAGSTVVAGRDFGAFVVSTSVETPATAPAFEQILVELRTARAPGGPRPFTPDELARSKAHLVSAQAVALESVDELRADLAVVFVSELPHDYFARFSATIGAITVESVVAEAQHLTPDRLVIVAVGDRRTIAEPLQRAIGRELEEAPAALLD